MSGIRRRHDPDIHGPRSVVADALDFSLFENAQELHLRGQGHLAHFIEEQSSPISELELAFTVGRRTGERTPDMTEQLALDRPFRHPAAVERHEPLVGTLGQVVDRPGDQLLASTTFAENEHRCAGRRDLYAPSAEPAPSRGPGR